MTLDMSDEDSLQDSSTSCSSGLSLQKPLPCRPVALKLSLGLLTVCPEVPKPVSNVHYLQALPQQEGNADDMGVLFDTLPSERRAFLLLHRKSQLYVTGERLHNGLVWFTQSQKTAVRFVIAAQLTPHPNALVFKKLPIHCSHTMSPLTAVDEKRLLLTVDDNAYTCNSCSESFLGIARFRCDTCDFDLCLECATLLPASDTSPLSLTIGLFVETKSNDRFLRLRLYSPLPMHKVKDDLGKPQRSLVLSRCMEGPASDFSINACSRFFKILKLHVQSSKVRLRCPVNTHACNKWFVTFQGLLVHLMEFHNKWWVSQTAHRLEYAPGEEIAACVSDAGPLDDSKEEIIDVSERSSSTSRESSESTAGSDGNDYEFIRNSELDQLAFFCGIMRLPMYFQSKCVAQNGLCTSSFAAPLTVVAFEDLVLTRLLRNTAERKDTKRARLESASPPNAAVARLMFGTGSSRGAANMIITTQAVPKGSAFILSPESVHALSYLTEEAYYNECFRRVVNPGEDAPSWRCAPLPESVELSSLWPDPLYYCGYRVDMAQPATSPSSGRCHVTYPFTLLELRHCQHLPGQCEIVAAFPIPKLTLFLYAGPLAAHNADGSSAPCTTSFAIGEGREIRGGNLMRYVNHYFGFFSTAAQRAGEKGNVCFRAAHVVYQREKRQVKTKNIVFLVAKREIEAGEPLLAESYSAEYDAYLERLALCRGYFLSFCEIRNCLTTDSELQRLVKLDRQVVQVQYDGVYRKAIGVGSLVGHRRQPGLVPDVYSVRRLRKKNASLELELLDGTAFPTYTRFPRNERTSVVLPADNVFLLVWGWDAEEDTHQAVHLQVDIRQLTLLAA